MTLDRCGPCYASAVTWVGSARRIIVRRWVIGRRRWLKRRPVIAEGGAPVSSQIGAVTIVAAIPSTAPTTQNGQASGNGEQGG